MQTALRSPEEAASTLRAGIPETLRFLERLTRDPSSVTAADVRPILDAGVPPAAIEDAIQVGAAFNSITRLADALEFAVPSPEQATRAAKQMYKRNYG